MSDDIIEHIRKLMKIADLADGVDDGKISKVHGGEYMHVLIRRAEKLGCTQEKKLLVEINDALQKIQKPELDSAESRFPIPDFAVRKGLRAELFKIDEGKKVLLWDEVPHCAGMDYSLPPHLQKATASHKKREH